MYINLRSVWAPARQDPKLLEKMSYVTEFFRLIELEHQQTGFIKNESTKRYFRKAGLEFHAVSAQNPR